MRYLSRWAAGGVLTLVFGLVVVAGFVRDALGVGVLPHARVIPPVTGTSVSTVNNILD